MQPSLIPFLIGTALARVIQSPTPNITPNTANETALGGHSITGAQGIVQVWRPLVIKRETNSPEAENTAFTIALRKGTTLLTAMMENDKQAAQVLSWTSETAESKFLDFFDLEKWGYGTMEYDEYYDFDASLPIKPALESIGVAAKKLDEGGTNRAIIWEHENETTHGGMTYPPTHASYTTLFNPEDGIIIGWGAFSPTYMGPKQNPPVAVVPALKQWSDATFLQWADLSSGKHIRNIRFIMKTPCENAITQEVIKAAMKRTKQELQRWPGVTFEMDSVEGKAILGSPNGLGVAFMLIQHKRQLGNKVVEKVTVFQDEGKTQPRPPSILFFVKNFEAMPETPRKT